MKKMQNFRGPSFEERKDNKEKKKLLVGGRISQYLPYSHLLRLRHCCSRRLPSSRGTDWLRRSASLTAAGSAACRRPCLPRRTPRRPPHPRAPEPIGGAADDVASRLSTTTSVSQMTWPG